MANRHTDLRNFPVGAMPLKSDGKSTIAALNAAGSRSSGTVLYNIQIPSKSQERPARKLASRDTLLFIHSRS